MAGATTYVNATATDSTGNVYVTGSYYPQTYFDATHSLSTSFTNAFVAKYSSAGALLWDVSFGSSTSSSTGNSIAVDSSGNVYTTGLFFGTNASFAGTGSGGILTAGPGFNDSYVSKLNSNGANVWVHDLGSGASRTTATGIAVDSSGNVYTTGYCGVSRAACSRQRPLPTSTTLSVSAEHRRRLRLGRPSAAAR